LSGMFCPGAYPDLRGRAAGCYPMGIKAGADSSGILPVNKPQSMFSNEAIFFSAFLVLILLILIIDLGVFSKKNHIIKFGEAIAWTSVWVAFALGFYFFLGSKGEMVHGISSPQELAEKVEQYRHPVELTGNFEHDLQAYRSNLSLEYITGYLIEYALSIDNIFVMIVIFGAFGVREKYYKRILFWGVLGAVVMRFVFIFLGAGLLERFHWIVYVFGAILVYTGVKLLFEKDQEKEMDPATHPVVRFLSRFLRIYPRYIGSRFFIRKEGLCYVTPLFIALMVVEFTDVVFAFDSVPAIFSITKDPYIVFFSNIFAIMGLRSLFFLLTNILHLFHFLKYGLGVLLLFIGVKMMVHTWMVEWGFTTKHSLYTILTILFTSVVLSLLFPKKGSRLNGQQ
jgi:tellurite resistance protein TerC